MVRVADTGAILTLTDFLFCFVLLRGLLTLAKSVNSVDTCDTAILSGNHDNRQEGTLNHLSYRCQRHPMGFKARF